MEMLMKKHTVISVAATIAVAMSLSGCAGTFDELFDSSKAIAFAHYVLTRTEG